MDFHIPVGLKSLNDYIETSTPQSAVDSDWDYGLGWGYGLEDLKMEGRNSGPSDADRRVDNTIAAGAVLSTKALYHYFPVPEQYPMLARSSPLSLNIEAQFGASPAEKKPIFIARKYSLII
ncbi:hypothetical protein F0562_027106 [Nyssa sinensis]|uniref:Uncharacterized protein n=1 Tax=Nyssa sinensis TaxID=561372 RepID=A0A5J5B4A5_9ASTE|nr:hypothetical protein F0562_027106 [Nyssa sinensis]